MKKVALAGTALISALHLSGAAQAADPIKLEVGGYMNQWLAVVFQENDTTGQVGRFYTHPVNGQTATNPNEHGHFASLTDAEIHFKGETTLDSGLKIAVVFELEAERMSAGGSSAGQGNNSTSRNADQQYLVLTSGFGELSMGERDNVQLRAHNAAPRFGAGLDIIRQVIVPRGTAANGMHVAAPSPSGAYDTTGLDAMDGTGAVKIDYLTPQFWGLTLGLGYTPTNGSRGLANKETQQRDMMSVVLAYQRAMGEDFKVGLDVGYGHLLYNHNPTLGANVSGQAHGISSGGKISWNGLSIGGSHLRIIDNYRNDATPQTGGSIGGWAWDAGASYESGPWGLSVTYYKEAQKADPTVRGNDTVTQWALGGKYDVGPGVSFVASAHRAVYKDEINIDATNTSGWAFISGVNLTF